MVAERLVILGCICQAMGQVLEKELEREVSEAPLMVVIFLNVTVLTCTARVVCQFSCLVMSCSPLLSACSGFVATVVPNLLVPARSGIFDTVSDVPALPWPRRLGVFLSCCSGVNA